MCEPMTALAIAGVIGTGASLYTGAKARTEQKKQQKLDQEKQDERDRIASIPKPTLEDPAQKDTEAERRKRIKTLEFGMSSTIKSSINKKELGLKTKLGQ